MNVVCYEYICNQLPTLICFKCWSVISGLSWRGLFKREQFITPTIFTVNHSIRQLSLPCLLWYFLCCSENSISLVWRQCFGRGRPLI